MDNSQLPTSNSQGSGSAVATVEPVQEIRHRLALAFGAALQNFWWAMILVAVFVAVQFRRMLADEEKRFGWDGRVLSTRWVGDLVGKIETARLTRTLGTLLSNGVPLLSALSIARNVITNTVLRKDVSDAAREVKTGGGLSRNLWQTARRVRTSLHWIVPNANQLGWHGPA